MFILAAPYFAAGSACAGGSCSCTTDTHLVLEEDAPQFSQMAGQLSTYQEAACHVQGMGWEGGGEQQIPGWCRLGASQTWKLEAAGGLSAHALLYFELVHLGTLSGKEVTSP